MKLAFISTYPPKKCGIATFTARLRESIQKGFRLTDEQLPVWALVEKDESVFLPAYASTLVKEEPAEYVRVAREINASDIDVISLQHEFGIFGGEAGQFVGDYVLYLLRYLQKPVVTTFHTVFSEPKAPHKQVQQEIISRSQKIVVMNRLVIPGMLHNFDLPRQKVAFIPHGVPVPPVTPRTELRRKRGLANAKVLMTFGLLSPGKGIEMLLETLPQVVQKVPNLLYLIVGQTHPEVKKREGEQYRQKLESWVRQHHLQSHVRFIDRYLSEDELCSWLMSCDVYVTPYPGMQQVTSGTLSYAVGMGRAVLSTPYAYARDLLSDYPELLLPYGAYELWAQKLTELLTKEEKRHHYERAMQKIGQGMHWNRVGQLFYQLCQESASKKSGVRHVATNG